MPAPSRLTIITVKNQKFFFDFLRLYNELGKVKFFQVSIIWFRVCNSSFSLGEALNAPPVADRVKYNQNCNLGFFVLSYHLINLQLRMTKTKSKVQKLEVNSWLVSAVFLFSFNWGWLMFSGAIYDFHSDWILKFNPIWGSGEVLLLDFLDHKWPYSMK